MLATLKTSDRFRLGVLSLSLLAWLFLLTPSAPGHHCSPGATLPTGNTFSAENVSATAKAWGIMLVAMMAPMLTAPLYFIYTSSFTRVRNWLVGLCALGYAVMWILAGAMLATGQLAANARFPGSWWPALVVGAAALIWQASPWKNVCLNRCHQYRPISAFGPSAHADAFRMGVEQGLWCVGSCWLNMLWPMLLPAGHIPAMMAVSLLAFCERLEPAAVPTWRLRGLRTAYLYLAWMWRARQRPVARWS